jgi:hypothetical protein
MARHREQERFGRLSVFITGRPTMLPSRRENKKRLLDEMDPKAQCRPANNVSVPRIGIVFLVKGKVLVDSTPVIQAESYAHFKIHPHDHPEYWEHLRKMGAVPADVEYDEVPRGRVVYDTKSRKYTLFLDRCILKNKKLVSSIMEQMNLAYEDTETSTDSHYRCPKCLHKQREE